MNEDMTGRTSQPELEQYEPELYDYEPEKPKTPVNKLNVLMIFVWVAVLIMGGLFLLNQDQNNGLSTTNPSAQTSANNSSVNPASLITPSAAPTPLGGVPVTTPAPSTGNSSTPAQLLSSGGGGSSSSHSGAGNSSSSTNLSTNNVYSYYSTGSNGQQQVALTTPTPTPNPVPSGSTPTPVPTSAPSVLGTSTGNFIAGTPVNFGTNSVDVAHGDFNGDGKTDLAVLTLSGYASIYLNTGSGLPATASSTITAGSFPWSITVGDFSGDGKPDLAIPNYLSNTVSVFINNGNGTFASKVDYPTGSVPEGAAAADFNGDGKIDLAVVNTSGGTISLFLNTGSGLPASPSTLTSGGNPSYVVAADFNGDGKTDLATSSYGTNQVFVFMNSGSGLPTTPSKTLTTGAGSTPEGIAAADFNADGKADLAVANRFLNAVYIYISAGASGLPTSASYAFTTGIEPFTVAAADLDANGTIDLVIPNRGADTISVLMGLGGGTFATKVDYSTGSGSAPYSVTIGDFNADGGPDLAVANSGSNYVSIFLNVISGSTSFVFSGSSSQAAGAYAPISVTLHDFYGNVINATSNVVVNLTNNISNGVFYPTSSGGTPISSITIPSGSNTSTFWFRATQTGSGNITGSATGYPAANFADTVNPGTASVAVITPASQNIIANQPSSVFTLTTKDPFGNTNNVASNTTFTLSDSASGQFSLTSSPFTSVGTVTVNSGSSSTTFYYKASAPGSYTITAHNAGFTDGTTAVTVNQATITQFYYNVAPASGTAGSASTVFTVGAKDTNGNVVVVSSNRNVYLYSSGSGGTFSTTSGGTYTSALTITITTGSTTADYYYKNSSTTGSPYTLTASDNSSAPDGATGIADTTTSYAVNVGAASQYTLTPSTQTVTANNPSSVITLTTKDSFGNVSAVSANKTFTLSDASSGQFSVLSSPFTPVTTVTVNSSTSSTTLFYKASVPGTYTITATLAGFTATSGGNAVMTVNQAAITQFYYNVAPASGTAGTASTVFTVGAKDTNGNVVVVSSNRNVFLYSSGSGGTFSTTSGGTYTPALTITILSGSSSADYYYKNNSTSGSPYTLTASDNSSAPDGATGIADATTSYALNAGTASVAVLTPSAQTVTANLPSSVITLTTKDSLGNTVAVGSNTTFTLSDASTGQFSLTSSPFTPVGSVTVNSGSFTATFYYKATTPGVYTVTAHNAGFTDGTSTITVNQAGIVSYYYATAPATGAAGASSTVFTVGAHDAFGNVVTVGSNQTVYLYSSAPAGTFSSPTNSNFTATSATILSGNTTADFYYKNNSTSGSPYTLTVSDNSSAPDGATGIVDATTNYSVTSGAATTSSLTPSSQSVTAGSATSAITLTTKDSLGNPTAVGSNTTFTLSDANGGQFSVLASPFTPVASVTVTSGSSTTTFYYRNNTAGSYTITASNGGFSPNSTTSVTVTSAAIASYYFVAAGTSTNINVSSSAFTVGAHDVYGNVVTVGSNTTVYLYSTSGTGTFSNTTNAGPFTATTVTILAASTTATFYYKDATAGAYTLTASEQTPTPTPDTGATNATTAFTVFNPDVLVGPNAPIPHRSATVSDSRPGDPNVHYSWNSSSASIIKAVRILVCDNGLSNTACVVPTGSNFSTTTLTSTGGELGVTGWSLSIVNPHEILVTNSTGATTTIGGNSTLDIAGFVGPTSIGTYFFRIMTYTTTAALPGDSVSYGAIGTSTNRSITVTGDVAESLVFRVANSVASDCSSQTDIADPNDAASDLVTLSPNPMTMTATSVGTAQMCATSNAQHGYTITYFDAALGGATKGFYNGSHEFTTGSVSQFTSTQGTEQFGFNLRANTTPSVGFDPDGNGLVADLTNADYGTVNRFSYNDTGTPTILAQKSVPNAATARYTMSYIANISSTTQGGTYKAHQVFVITATF